MSIPPQYRLTQAKKHITPTTKSIANETEIPMIAPLLSCGASGDLAETRRKKYTVNKVHGFH